MKKCVKCGYELNDDAAFCRKCGEPQPAISAQNPVTPTPSVTKVNIGKNIDFKKLAIKIGIPLLVLLIGFGLFRVLYKPTIDLNKYVTVDFKGYDSIGKVQIDYESKDLNERLDKILPNKTDKLLDKIEDQLDLNFKNKKALKDYIATELSSFEIDQKDKLLNGDTVNLTWNLVRIGELQELAELCGFKVKAEDRVLTVEGLKEVGLENIWDNLEIEYSGISGNGYMNIKPYKDNYNIEVENNGSLSNGDKVMLSLSENELIRMIEETGKRPNPVSKEIEISELNEFLKSAEKLTEDSYKKITDAANRAVNKFVKETYSKNATINSVTCEQVNVLSKNNKDSYGDESRIEFVYRINSSYYYDTGLDEYQSTQDAFFVIWYPNVLVKPNGDIAEDYVFNAVEDRDHNFPVKAKSNSSDHTMPLRFYGHATLEDYEDKHLKTNSYEYTYTSKQPLSKESIYGVGGNDVSEDSASSSDSSTSTTSSTLV